MNLKLCQDVHVIQVANALAQKYFESQSTGFDTTMKTATDTKRLITAASALGLKDSKEFARASKNDGRKQYFRQRPFIDWELVKKKEGSPALDISKIFDLIKMHDSIAQWGIINRAKFNDIEEIDLL